jgi:hypothetical protein
MDEVGGVLAQISWGAGDDPSRREVKRGYAANV